MADIASWTLLLHALMIQKDLMERNAYPLFPPPIINRVVKRAIQMQNIALIKTTVTLPNILMAQNGNCAPSVKLKSSNGK